MSERPGTGPFITLGDPATADVCVDGWCGPLAADIASTADVGRPTMITIQLTEQELVAGRLSDEHRRVAPPPCGSTGSWSWRTWLIRRTWTLCTSGLSPTSGADGCALPLERRQPPAGPAAVPAVPVRRRAAEPFVIAVTSALLSPGVKNVMYGGNTALPGDQRQPVHADVGHLWPLDALEVAHPASQLVINVATVDVSPENGATEVWPRKHGGVLRPPGADHGGLLHRGADRSWVISPAA
ncbi:MAG TPA: hypothetical protein VIT41_02375 [Microlunatus sp.]